MPKRTDVEVRRIARLLEHVKSAQAVCARDHSRNIGGSRDAYAYDFGALEVCVEMIAEEVNALFPTSQE